MDVIAGRSPRIAGIVTDLDGTLLRSDGTLSPLTLTMLESVRRRGLSLVVATARTPRALRKIAGHNCLGLVVCANGAIVWDASSNEVIEEHCFVGEHIAPAVADLRRDLPGAGMALLSAQTMFLDDAYVALRGKAAAGATVIADVRDVVPANDIVVVSVRHPDRTAEQLIDSVALTFDGVGVASFAGTSTVDVVPLGCTKAGSVERVLGRAGCRLRDMVAFGDMPNDLGLLTAAGWGCAVRNAHPVVLAAADEVVPSNDDDGVARTALRIFDL